MSKKLTSVATGITLILIVTITFALIIGEFKQSIKQIDREVVSGNKIDQKLLHITKEIK